jgi:UDP-N-acetylglucosamine transferase subunit ALG13
VATNQKLEVTFNKALRKFKKKTFVLTTANGTSRIAGKLSYSKKTKKLLFTPKIALTKDSQYIVRVKGGYKSKPNVQDLRGNIMKSDYVWSFRTGSDADTDEISDASALTVSFTNPVNGADNVDLNAKVLATYNEAISSSTVDFNLVQGIDPIAGSLVYLDKTIIFSPTADLIADSDYTATLTSQVRDLANNIIETNYVWSFSTGSSSDETAPVVDFVSPLANATAVALNTTLSIDFSEVLNPATVSSSTFLLNQGSTPISGTVAYLGKTVLFTPAANLSTNSLYTVTVTNQVADLAGNLLAANYVWSFTTNSVVDSTAPVVQSVSPVDGSTAVALNRSFTANFSESMDPSTFTTSTFILRQGATLIPSTVAYSGTTAVLIPLADLEINTGYTATINTQVKDLAANALATNYVWSFTTGQNQHEPVVLRTTSSYVVLAGSTVTSTGPTIITGDVGLSPGSAMTGFPPGTINGTLHINDAESAQAKLDLTTAYNEAEARSLAPVTISGNLGGLTLAPGLYKSGSTAAISSGDLTLDAQGDANAVFIFQIASGFTVTSGRQVILSGGAQADNVFWQVGTSATFGTNSVFKGNILVDQSITFETGATLVGRALTRIGAVTMDSNTMTRPGL